VVARGVDNCCCVERGVGDMRNRSRTLLLLPLPVGPSDFRLKDSESELKDDESAPRARGGTRGVGPDGMLGLFDAGEKSVSVFLCGYVYACVCVYLCRWRVRCEST
jgi:hypothetical protein